MTEKLHQSTRTKISDAIELVAEAFDKAKEHDLECEVMATALVFLKDNPDRSIEEALAAGLEDWDV